MNSGTRECPWGRLELRTWPRTRIVPRRRTFPAFAGHTVRRPALRGAGKELRQKENDAQRSESAARRDGRRLGDCRRDARRRQRKRRDERHPGLRHHLGADLTRRRRRLRRRVAARDRPAHRGSRRAQARHDDHPAAARPLVEGHEQGSRLDVQPPQRRPVPRRHAVQRAGRLRELRPVVQLHRPVRVGRDLVLLLHRLQRLQEEGCRAHEQPALPQLPGTERQDGGRHAAACERRVPRRPLADVVPHPEPDRDDAVRREQGPALERRRLHADRRVRRARRPGRRHRAVQARVVEDRRPARDRAERSVLGQEGDPAARDLPGDPGQRRTPAGAPDGRDPGLRPRRAAGHPDDQAQRAS